MLDNGHFGETGMQRSHTSLGTDLVAVAKGFGIANAFAVDKHREAATTSRAASTRDRAPSSRRSSSKPNEPPRALPPRDGSFIKNRFRAALGLKPF